MAPYPIKLYELAALYIINIKIHLTIKKGTTTVNAYININMTKSQDEKKGGKKKDSCSAGFKISDVFLLSRISGL